MESPIISVHQKLLGIVHCVHDRSQSLVHCVGIRSQVVPPVTKLIMGGSTDMAASLAQRLGKFAHSAH